MKSLLIDKIHSLNYMSSSYDAKREIKTFLWVLFAANSREVEWDSISDLLNALNRPQAFPPAYNEDLWQFFWLNCERYKPTETPDGFSNSQILITHSLVWHILSL